MAEWYVYQHDGEPLGPLTTEVIASSILGGQLAPETWVAPPGGPKWLRALDVPVIVSLIGGTPTPRRRESGLMLMPGTFRTAPRFGSTVMMVKDDEIETFPDSPPTEQTQIVGSLIEPPAPAPAPARTKRRSG